MSADEGYEDRPLPGHLFRELLDGKITAHEADRQARDHYRHADARGGDMSDRMRQVLGINSAADQRARQAQIQADERARDERGRFASDDGKPASMNALIRARMRGPSSEQGTVDLSHLTTPPPAAA